MEQTPLGYHILLDLWECKNRLYTQEESSGVAVERIIADNKLTVLKSTVHIFENNSWSLCVMLAESHVTCHTWPEKNYVSADIFVCNYSRDNLEAAEKVAYALVVFFKSEHFEQRLIRRRSEPNT